MKVLRRLVIILLSLMMISTPVLEVSAAKHKDMFKKADSIKGMQGTIYASTFGGVDHNLMNLHLDECIFEPGSTGWKFKYEFEGETFYFNDPLGYDFISRSNKNNMSISIVFLLRMRKDAHGNSSEFLIDSASRKAGYAYYAPNCDLSTYGGRAIRAYWHFLMEKLQKEGSHIDNFILGNEVNMPNSWHYSGGVDNQTVANKYADAFYIMYSAVKKYSDVSRCSVSVDHSWNHDDVGRGITVKKFLHMFNDRLEQHEENVEWCVSAHLYPGLLFDTRIWKHPYGLATNSSDTKMVDGTNLSVMTNYIREEFGVEHRVMLTEQGFGNAFGQEAQAACLAYTYYAAKYDPMVDSFLILNADAGSTVYAGKVYGMNFKIDGTLAGEVYTKIDNGNEEDQQWIADVCLPVIGVSSWSEIIPNFGNTPNRDFSLVSDIQIEEKDLTINVPDTYTLHVAVLPENADNKTLTWFSSDESVVTVKDGVLTAMQPGTATITASATDGAKVSAVCEVNVQQLVTGVGLSEKHIALFPGKNHTLNASVTPENADNKTLTWSSSDKSIVSVENGKLTAKQLGHAVVTATATDGSKVYDRCEVMVIQPVAEIVLSENVLEMKVGKNYTLQANALPEDAGNRNLIWKSENDEIVTAFGYGNLSAKAEGTTKIIASATDGSGVSAECTVIVTNNLFNEIADFFANIWE